MYRAVAVNLKCFLLSWFDWSPLMVQSVDWTCFVTLYKVSQLTVLEKPNHEVKNCIQSPETGFYGGAEMGKGYRKMLVHWRCPAQWSSSFWNNQARNWALLKEKSLTHWENQDSNFSLILQYPSSSAQDQPYSEVFSVGGRRKMDRVEGHDREKNLIQRALDVRLRWRFTFQQDTDLNAQLGCHRGGSGVHEPEWPS